MQTVTSTGIDLALLFHNWQPHPHNADYLLLQGFTNALVRVKPMPLTGKYLWQFRKFACYADTVDEAKAYVEAGAEFFETFRRNPYAQS